MKRMSLFPLLILASSGLRPVRIERVWRAFDRDTGNSLGDYEVRGRQEISR